jgi:ABC-2 type transport system ATP-binding protein
MSAMLPQQRDSGASMSDIVLRASELTRRYGDLLAVDRLSLEVRRGEILGFLGPNGAGKSTTIHMLCGLLRPTAGSVEIEGQRLEPGAGRGLRSVGVCPQDIVIWDTLTCREQLAMMGQLYGLDRRYAQRRADTLLEALGLQAKARRLARTLSGGMKRRLNIALALVHEPSLLFLDEPQAGLDPQSRVMVRDYVGSLRRQVTVVLTTHDMEEAEKLSDRVCIIDRGRILALGTVQAIKDELGQGDLLEIELDPAAVSPVRQRLAARGFEATTTETAVAFATTRATQLLPDLLEDLRSQGHQLRGLRVRQRTLEDVFIKLTGRGLRE